MIVSSTLYKVSIKDLAAIYNIANRTAEKKMSALKKRYNTNRLTIQLISEVEKVNPKIIQNIIARRNKIEFTD
jgi:hypothetical protein